MVASAAFLATVLIVQLWTGGVDGPVDAADMLRYVNDISDVEMGYIAYGVAGIVLSIVFIPMCFGVHRKLGRSTRAWFGTVAVVVGLSILLPAYVIALLPAVGMVPAAETLGVAGAEALFAINDMAGAASVVFFTVGSLLTLSFGPLLWATESLSNRTFSRGISWVGVVTGVTGFVWFVWFLDSPVLLLLLIVNVLASLVYFAGISISMLRSTRDHGDGRRSAMTAGAHA